jgi:hypothetical protein
VSTINGLPAHVLLVHAVVTLIPLSALLLMLTACWPAARRRFSLLSAAVATMALISVPITTSAGDWLEHHLPRTPLLRIHTELGDFMLPWTIAVFALAAVIEAREFVRARRSTPVHVTRDTGAVDTHATSSGGTGDPGGRPITIAIAALALVASCGALATVYRIGDSGARAAWSGQYSTVAVPASPPGS